MSVNRYFNGQFINHTNIFVNCTTVTSPKLFCKTIHSVISVYVKLLLMQFESLFQKCSESFVIPVNEHILGNPLDFLGDNCNPFIVKSTIKAFIFKRYDSVVQRVNHSNFTTFLSHCISLTVKFIQLFIPTWYDNFFVNTYATIQEVDASSLRMSQYWNIDKTC